MCPSLFESFFRTSFIVDMTRVIYPYTYPASTISNDLLSFFKISHTLSMRLMIQTTVKNLPLFVWAGRLSVPAPFIMIYAVYTRESNSYMLVIIWAYTPRSALLSFLTFFFSLSAFYYINARPGAVCRVCTVVYTLRIT